eukprot:PhM_4_TR9971/c0_g1_i1/m.13502
MDSATTTTTATTPAPASPSVLWGHSRWMSLLDSVNMYRTSTGDDGAVATIPVPSIAASFIQKHYDVIVEDARSRNLEIIVEMSHETEPKLLVALSRDKVVLTDKHVADLRDEALALFSKENWADLATQTLCETTVRACVSMLEASYKDLLGDKIVAHLKAVQTNASQPVGLPEYEVGFSAGGTTIMHPHEAAFLSEGYPDGERRRELDLVMSMVLWMPHELTHCLVDGVVGSVGAGTSTAEVNWRMEYVACWMQFSILAAVVREMRRKAQNSGGGGADRPVSWPNSALEEVALWALRYVHHNKGKHSDAFAKAQRWVQSEGLEAPYPDVQPGDFMIERHVEYLTMLTYVAVCAFEATLSVVECDGAMDTYLSVLRDKLKVIMSFKSDEDMPTTFPLVLTHSGDEDVEEDKQDGKEEEGQTVKED